MVLSYKADLSNKAEAKRRKTSTPGDILFLSENMTCQEGGFSVEDRGNVYNKLKSDLSVTFGGRGK